MIPIFSIRIQRRWVSLHLILLSSIRLLSVLLSCLIFLSLNHIHCGYLTCSSIPFINIKMYKIKNQNLLLFSISHYSLICVYYSVTYVSPSTLNTLLAPPLFFIFILVKYSWIMSKTLYPSLNVPVLVFISEFLEPPTHQAYHLFFPIS